MECSNANDRSLDETVISELKKLETVEPSHQLFEVDAIRAVARAHPKLRQVAVFNTSFHRTMPPVAQRLPEAPDRELSDRCAVQCPDLLQVFRVPME